MLNEVSQENSKTSSFVEDSLQAESHPKELQKNKSSPDEIQKNELSLDVLNNHPIQEYHENNEIEEVPLLQGRSQIINRRPFFSFPKQSVALVAATTATGVGIFLNLVNHPAPKTIGAVLSTAGFFGVQAANAWTRQSKRRPIQEEYTKFQKKTQQNSQIELQKLRPVIDDYGLHLNRRDKVCDRWIHLICSFLYLAAGALLIARAFDEEHSLPLGLAAGGSIFLVLLTELITHIVGNHNLDRYLLQLKDANEKAQDEAPEELGKVIFSPQ